MNDVMKEYPMSREFAGGVALNKHAVVESDDWSADDARYLCGS